MLEENEDATRKETWMNMKSVKGTQYVSCHNRSTWHVSYKTYEAEDAPRVQWLRIGPVH